MASRDRSPYRTVGGGEPMAPPPVPIKDHIPGSGRHTRITSAEMPRLEATFVPGGFDDYYMPEVIAPSPQRVMPEVPQNMQQDLHRMEAEARNSQPRKDSLASPTTDSSARLSNGHVPSINRDKTTGTPAAGERGQPPPAPPAEFKPFTSEPSGSSTMDGPSFSPFPKVQGENIPPSDDGKEEILWQARDTVLHSNNVSMQVSWARDALTWVEVNAEAQARARKRENKGRDRERAPTPKVEHDLRVDAVNIVEYLAQQNHPEAMFMRAKWQEFGKFGQRENKREAYLGYKKSAEMGWGRAEYRIGMLYENSNDIDKAIKHYNQGVLGKDSAANYRLGMMYLMGQHGVQRDMKKGLDMIQKAADQADEDAPQGAYVYGMLIARELPDINIPENLLPVELNTARQYIEKAAYLGFAKAQLKMGQAYELSQLGCDFNPAYSLHYYGLAARQGQPEAALGVSRWFLFGYEKTFAKNEQLAYKYALEAAEAGLPTGEFAMGYYYEIGIHIPKDLRQARKWYEQAAEHGNNDAKTRLQNLDQSKTLTKQDHETTTLTRIKSQHGSQRGKRPERFTKPDVMPTVTETASTAIRQSPKASPSHSPNRAPVVAQDKVDYPDPSYSTASRPPAFTVNIDNKNLAVRPKSSAPYPEDDRPAPLKPRPKSSTAPYPEDDMRGPAYYSHPNGGVHPQAGPAADRPGSAFGIRSFSAQQSLQPSATPEYRGRLPASHSAGSAATTGWEPQIPAGYRQSSLSSPQHLQAPYSQPQIPPQQQRLGAASAGPGASVPSGGAPVGDPTRNRLHKPNGPSYNQPPSPVAGQYPAGSYGGRDYGPRTSSRPSSDVYGAAPPSSHSSTHSLPSSAGHGRIPSGGGGAGAPRPPAKQYEPLMSGGRASAPPVSAARPSSHSPALSTASTTNLPGHGRLASGGYHPESKPTGQGPATFEEMGIPQGKNEGDCVVM